MNDDKELVEKKDALNKIINGFLSLIDFSLAIYLVYNLIAMFNK